MAIQVLNQYTCDICKSTETVNASNIIPDGWSVITFTNNVITKKDYTACPTHTQAINNIVNNVPPAALVA